MTKRYVLGFMIDTFGESANVLLIRKQRPEWQKDRLNGIGGKIEEGESPHEAMVREFREETNIPSNVANWRHFTMLSGPERYVGGMGTAFEIYVFVTEAILPKWDWSKKAPTDEVPVEVPVRDLWSHPVLPNLLWMVPMAYSLIMRGTTEHAPGFDVREWAR